MTSTHRYTDSIVSSSHYYTNPYREDADYRKAQGIKAAEKATLDSIESPQQRLERELLEKIISKKKRFSIPFIIFKRLGKFFFIVAFFPPYAIFYSFPRLAFQLLGGFYRAFKDKVDIRVGKVVNLLIAPYEKVQKGPIAALNKQLDVLKGMLAKRISALQYKIVMLKNNWVDPLVAFFSSQQKQISLFIKRALPRVKIDIRMPKAFSLLTLEQLRQFFPKWKFSLKLPLKVTFEQANIFSSLKNRLAFLREIVKRSVKEPVEVVMRQISAAWLFLWQPILQLQLPTYDLSAFKLRTKAFLQHVIRISKIPLAFVAKMQAAMSKTLGIFANRLGLLGQYLGQKKQKFSSMVEKLNRAVQKGALFLGIWGGRLSGFLFSWFKKVVLWLAAANGLALSVFHIAFSYCTRLSRFAVGFFYQFILSVRILFALLSILVKYTFQNLKEQILAALQEEHLLENQQKSE
ncbi:MAG: hypothetical protein ACSNEK_05055 [Parachlamydiaceae bacterium]